MILKYFDRQTKIITAVAIAISMVSIYLQAEIPDLMHKISNAFITGSTEGVPQLINQMYICAAFSFAASFSVGLLSGLISRNVTKSVRKALYDKLGELSQTDVDRITAASLSTRMTADVTKVAEFCTGMTVVGFSLPMTLIVIIPVLMTKTWQWNLVILISMAIATVQVLIAVTRAVPNMRREKVLYDHLQQSTLEYLDGLMTVRTYNGMERHRERFHSRSGEILDNDMGISRRVQFIGPMVEMLAVAIPLVIYTVGYLIMPGKAIDQQFAIYSDMIAYVMYTQMLLGSAAMTLNMVSLQYPVYSVSRRRIEEVISTESFIKEGDRENPVHGGAIEFRNVTFTYPDTARPVLKNLSFSIPAGCKAAIIGPTACGKSTVVELLSRNYDPDEGQILIDGMDLKDYRFSDLYARLAVDTQDSFVFTSTLKDNVLLGVDDDQYTDEEFDEVLKDCACDQFLSQLPDGADTVLEEKGRNLSGGQRQRVALARTVCKPAEIYIFDDSFSALDAQTHAHVKSALAKRLGNATVVNITQRISSIKDADMIFIIDGGKIMASGSHEELLETCAYYKDLTKIQQDWEAVS